jgi:hypothetical protein
MSFVQRTREPLTPARLLEVLRGEEPAAERLPSSISLDSLSEAIESLPADLSASRLDGVLVESVHSGLSGITHAEAADMRVWHWLCAVPFRGLVWRRWRADGEPATEDMEMALTDSVARRFLGSPSLAGVSRNTLARIWWTAEHLDGDYELARAALSRQDMFQAIFERLFGLHPPAARAAIRKFHGRSEDEIRRAARWLNYAGATAVLEALDETEIESILDESLAAPR